MFARTSRHLSKTVVRSISSSAPVCDVQYLPVTVTTTNIPQVSEGEKAWCDVYGVDYEKQIAESLHECPATAEAVACKSLPGTKSQRKTDVWNVVFGQERSP